MKNTIPQFDAYIEKSADFAQPILARLRKIFHSACPDIQEVMKWSVPHFEKDGLVGGMAAFKKHVSLGFWKSREMDDPHNLFEGDPKAGMCAIKFTDVRDVPPPKILAAYVRQAVKINMEKANAPKPKARKTTGRKVAQNVTVPADLKSALAKNRKARETFDNFSYTNRKEYVEWITEAKRDATREKRLRTTIEWLAEGKRRNWKYENC